MEVIGLSVSTQKAAPNEIPDSITLGTEGITGDRHAGAGMRQVSLMLEEHARIMAGETDAPLAGLNKENILIRTPHLLKISLMDRFVFGEVELEVTELGTEFGKTGAALCPPNAACGVSEYGIFLRVVQGGKISLGDAGEQRQRLLLCKIITLSDRASAGKYSDRSGDKVEALLSGFAETAGWAVEVERALLPDDAEALRTQLLDAKARGMGLVFTTGGTGVAPRDITPEVALSVADKIIPGIMEQVRHKYGAANPMAYLSRSVAVTMGGTLVYVLPGSVRAVEEYMQELLPTLEHLFLTLHGIRLH